MVKTQFGIKDLENLSNVKAHTIRMWEKRYNLLEPNRTDTNIRKYDIENLKKLLNIAYLYNAGYKISTLASFKPQQIQALIKDNLNNFESDYIINVFKSAMFEFDGDLFDTTLEKMLTQKSLREIFSEVFVPLLNEMGILWHSGTIDPSHEHFVSEKIKHTIIEFSKKEKEENKNENAPIFTLYLPYEEIHEIGLLYANYELLSKGQNTIYLGPNIPLESLNHILNTKKQIIFVTYFTVQPVKEGIEKYLHEFKEKVCKDSHCELWILGQKEDGQFIKNKNIKFFNTLENFINHIDHLKAD